MLRPCPKHVLCPPGTGTDSPGTNYSSEHIDVPQYEGRYYPPSDYNQWSACQGRCISTISQEDANLCAARLGRICIGAETGKTQYGNTIQSCTGPNSGTLVIVPADTFLADSVAEANAQALSYANNLQQPGVLPPGPHITPPPGGGNGNGFVPPNVIPIPVPTPQQHHQPPPPPTSQCKPCDDSAAVASFSTVCSVPVGTTGSLSWESPPLKCGRWTFAVVTNDGGSIDDPASFITLVLVADDPSRTYVDWASLENCEQMAYVNPCASSPSCDPTDTAAFAKVQTYCCNDTAYDCRWIECQTMPDGKHYMVRLQINYACMGGPTVPFSKQFTVNGTLTAPLPTP